MSDAMKALDEIELLLKSAQTNTGRISGYEDAMNDIGCALSLLPTLRAALTPPADDEVEAIRGRAEAQPSGFLEMPPRERQTYTDRATLLALVDRLSAELAKERERRVEWQPIETAPRDGQDILVYCHDTNEMFVGFSNPEEIAADPSIFFYALRTDGGRIGCRPHLWRPLPTPPATLTKDTP